MGSPLEFIVGWGGGMKIERNTFLYKHKADGRKIIQIEINYFGFD